MNGLTDYLQREKDYIMQTSQLKPKVGISSCLMGQAVRYNGGHQRNNYVMDVLAKHVELVPVCPEVEAGMGVPRPTIRMVRQKGAPGLVESGTGIDHSALMNTTLGTISERLKGLDLDGFLLKRASPTCGISGVKIYATSERKSQVVARGGGFFADRLKNEFETLALSEEGWLNDAMLRQQFLHRIFTARRLKVLRDNPTLKDLQREYAAHKLLYMAHHPGAQRYLGRRVAKLSGSLSQEQLSEHMDEAQVIMGHRLTRGRHVNVLQHILGYVSKRLSAPCRNHTLESIDAYSRGQTSLLAPLSLLKHQVLDKGAHPWLTQQVYFDPYPVALW
ncbi:MAG: DUF523 and DUF1722 domain-containing protein [Myxococcota bacterium]|nr:DUF523 and DUF1722 domain-containing protein [Myxococcota bacterium]